MINIKIPGKGSLHLPPDLVLSITVPSPFWFGGKLAVIPGGYSLPVTINANAHNRSMLGFPEFANIKTVQRSLPAELHLDGNYWDTGLLYVKQADRQRYKVQLFFGAGVLGGLKDKSLKDHDYGPVVQATDTLAAWDTFAATLNADPERMFSPLAHQPEGASGILYRHIGGWQVSKLLETVFTDEGFGLSDSVFSTFFLEKLFLSGDTLYVTNDGTDNPVDVDPADSVPDFPVLDFLKGLARNFCAGFWVDNVAKKVRLSLCKNALGTISIDLSDRQRGGFKLFYDDSFKVKEYSFEHDDIYRTSDDKLELGALGDSIGSPVGAWSEVHSFTDHGMRNALKASQDFNLQTAAGRTQNLSDKTSTGFLGFSAFRIDDDGKPYHEFTDLGSSTLHWNETLNNGFYESYWKPWLDALYAPVEVPMLLRWEDVHNVKDLLHNRVSLFDPAGGSLHNCLFREIKITVDMKLGLKPTVQKLAQLTN